MEEKNPASEYRDIAREIRTIKAALSPLKKKILSVIMNLHDRATELFPILEDVDRYLDFIRDFRDATKAKEISHACYNYDIIDISVLGIGIEEEYILTGIIAGIINNDIDQEIQAVTP